MKFEEQFPSLTSEDGKYLKCKGFNNKRLFPENLIQEHCIDKVNFKERIRQAYLAIGKEGQGVGEYTQTLFGFDIQQIMTMITWYKKKAYDNLILERIDKTQVKDLLDAPMELANKHIYNDALIKITQYEERIRIKKELGLD